MAEGEKLLILSHCRECSPIPQAESAGKQVAPGRKEFSQQGHLLIRKELDLYLFCFLTGFMC